jgi:hypothetical protein
MAQREGDSPRPVPPLRRGYEQSRLETQHLMTAYARVTPIRPHRTTSSEAIRFARAGHAVAVMPRPLGGTTP